VLDFEGYSSNCFPLGQAVKQNKTEISALKFRNANFWYSSGSVLKHRANILEKFLTQGETFLR
jgi:hypothetical protein